MASQAETIIVFVFRRSGKTELSFSDIYLTLSMELKWFSPESAKDFVNKAIEKKLLTKKESQIRPSFDISKIDVPLGFTPTGEIFEEKGDVEKKEMSTFDQIISKIADDKNIDRKIIFDEIKKIEKEKKLTKEVSALLYAKEFDIDFDSVIPKIEKEMF